MERLIKKRDGVKYQVDCICEYVSNVSSEDGHQVKTTVKTLANKEKALSVYKDKYEQCFEDLLLEATPDAVEEIHSSYKIFQDKCTAIEEIIDIIRDNYFTDELSQVAGASANPAFDSTILQAVKEIVNNQVETLQRITTQQQESFKDLLLSSKRVPSNEVKLPQLELKCFSGGYAQWVEFFDAFKCAVDSRANLAPVQKLQYLKSCLKGEAATLVRNLTLNDSNYSIAIELLKGRYENVKNIRESHFDAIFNISSVTKKNANNLRKLCCVLDENLQALKNLGEPIEYWDSWLVYHAKKKLDGETRFEWEKHTASVQNPTFKAMHDFISEHAYALEASESKKVNHLKFNQSTSTASSKCFTITQSDSCFLCYGDHRLSYCPEYTCLDHRQRKAKVLSLKLCINCFSRQHFVSRCPKPASCSHCKRKHHPTLHYDEQPKESIESSNAKQVNCYAECLSNVSTYSGKPVILNKEVLLATALVYATTSNGDKVLCRALLDPGSQSSFMTHGFAQRLRLKTTSLKNGISVNGIGSIRKGTLDKSACLNLSSLSSKCSSIMVNALVIDKITSDVPRRSVIEVDWPQLNSLELADPHFLTSGPVDVLLGADVYSHLILGDVGVLKSPDGEMLAQQSIFGWIITGSTMMTRPSENDQVEQENTLSHLIQTDDLLKRFWELEENPSAKCWSLEEKRCESHFAETTYREGSGRYVVSLPFKENRSFGESRAQALKRLHQTEKRLSRDPVLKESYTAVMKEYVDLNHAEKIPNKEMNVNNAYYMPHHAVIKESSSTTKVRVVFDASAKTSTGISLNDCLMVGPKIQEDLVDILTRFRLHPIAFSADIAKMYRQVILHPRDRDYHRFLWREDSTQEVEEYRMTTVTFGVSSSAYHAQRVLTELAKDEGSKYTLASPIVKRDLYMDDCLSGAADVSTAVQTQRELTDLLKEGGFDLRKWTSNSTELLKSIPQELCELKSDFDLDFGQSNFVIKTLGMYLCPMEDEFLFKVQSIESLSDVRPITKRIFLSDSSRIFDPLGLLAPVLITAKILFQSLWLQGISWDDPLPDDLLREWTKWRTELTALEELRMPRCIVPKNNSVSKYELHGFCDASESAYAAVVYMRTVSVSGDISINLVAAKTKVAPLKKQSIPRLELCGALLLARLVHRIVKAFSTLNNIILYCWTDSVVTLHWICGSPSKWQTFVGNRVSEIQDLTNPSSWRYCPTKENPADCASRGISPSDMLSHALWYTGPPWLQSTPDEWPTMSNEITTEVSTLEQRNNSVIVTNLVKTTELKSVFDLLPYSSFTKLVRVLAWCRRWRLRCTSVSSEPKPGGPLTTNELKLSLLFLVKESQRQDFSEEISCLKKGKVISSKSKLVSLHPFLDDNEVLRVGGRLDKSSLPYDQKHPVLLSKRHTLTDLIVQYEHLRNLHAGQQLLLATIRQTYWIIGARDLIRRLVHKCVVCRRQRAESLQQIMGSLPSDRITSGRAFMNTGVDFAGPVLMKSGRGRGTRNEKAWIALFVCLAVKAIHIELVTSLSTDAFLAALKRFVSRRGKPKAIYSDNGTNFVRANKELRQLTVSQEHNDVVRKYLQQDHIEWHFIPQRGSHFGGLWEAGVKSMKYHLRRIIGNVSLTYEELYTVLCQIEACLNSRPLTPLSSDPSDLQALTPGHFLVSAPLNALPEENVADVKVNRLNRWQHLHQLHQHFWKRWSTEYLSNLQQRPKWRKERRNLEKDDLVILQEDNTPPTKWVMGRVKELYLGEDNKCRVVTVKTANGLMKRPIAKLVLLLAEQED